MHYRFLNIIFWWTDDLNFNTVEFINFYFYAEQVLFFFRKSLVKKIIFYIFQQFWSVLSHFDVYPFESVIYDGNLSTFIFLKNINIVLWTDSPFLPDVQCHLLWNKFPDMSDFVSGFSVCFIFQFVISVQIPHILT